MKATLAIGAGLLGLTTLTFALSRLELGAVAVPVALLIAATKASAIGWFYMHLKERSGGSRLVLLVSLSLVVVLIVMVLLEAADRVPVANVPGPFVR